MGPLVRAKHPKIVLGVVGALIAVPVLGITISLVGANANTPAQTITQDVSMQDVSMQESAQDTTSVQQETVPTVAAAQEPTSESKATATPATPKIEKVTQPVVTEQVVNEPITVKKTTEVVGGWTAPVVNTGIVSLRAPQLNSDANVTLTVAFSPSANCVINGDQLTINEGTHVTVAYRPKATSTHRAWATTIHSEIPARLARGH
jgi:cytoskeletal protein RodZ